MTTAPVSTETTRGYDQPVVTQFSIFLPNRVGRLLDLTKRFDEHMVRVCSLAVLDSSDHAVIRMITSSSEGTRRILSEMQLAFMESTVLVVCIERDHTISQMCQYLLGAELNIRFAYPMFAWEGSPQTVVLAVDDPTLGGQILRRKEFRLLGEGDLPKFSK